MEPAIYSSTKSMYLVKNPCSWLPTITEIGGLFKNIGKSAFILTPSKKVWQHQDGQDFESADIKWSTG